MSYIVNRTYTEVSETSGDGDSAAPEAFQVEDLRSLDAYVLLGEPGSGKTETFRSEGLAADAKYTSARDFIAFSPRPEWHGKTIFIDALDETRAGGSDGITPLDKIRARLDEGGRPRFRISCRDADWLGSSDRKSLERVAPGEKLTVFRLDPLTNDQVLDILDHGFRLSDPQEFLRSAQDHGLEELLWNPQTLKLIVESVDEGKWPESRQEVFRLACDKLISEPNSEHQAAARHSAPSIPALRHAAGYLCAMHLIADLKGFSIGESTDSDVVGIREIPWKSLPLDVALKTRVFKSSDASGFEPVHRSVAEYLGALFISEVIADGLRLGRVLALICGIDGGVVSSLRGLHAWLAFHCPKHRGRLSEIDPLGVALYGAPGEFSPTEKKRLLWSFHREVERSEGFSFGDWNARLVGSLATADMFETFESILSSSSRTPEDQILARFVLDAVQYGKPIPKLDEILMSVARDASRWVAVRQRALKAFMHVRPSETAALLQLARDINEGKIDDPDDGLLGFLLDQLVPNELSPSMALSFFHPLKRDHFIGGYYVFWNSRFGEKISTEEIPAVLDVLASRSDLWDDRGSNLMIEGCVGSVLSRGIAAFGDSIPATQLLSWLSIPIGEYSHSYLDNKSQIWIKEWLESRPGRYQELVLIVIERCRGEDNLHSCLFREHSGFCGATPVGMAEFWLQQADNETNQQMADCFFERAIDLLSVHKSLSLEFFQSWVADRPIFKPVLERALEIPEWQKEHEENRKKWSIEEEARKREWIDNFGKELLNVPADHVRFGALHNLARAYRGVLIEAEGKSSRERLSNFLGGDEALVLASMEAFRKSLTRTDLPSVEEIVAAAANDSMYFIQDACLVGVEAIYKTNPKSVDALDDEVLAKVLAFRIADGTGNELDWFKYVARSRPELVAQILVTCASGMLKAGKEHINGLYELSSDEDYKLIARLALPELLGAFPSHLRKGQATLLDYLLRAALWHMDFAVLKESVKIRLGRKSLDVAQRVYWLACGLIVEPSRYGKRLDGYVGTNHERREHLGAFFDEGRSRRILLDTASVSTIGLLVRLLGPGCSPELPDGWFTAAMKTSTLVGALIDRLSAIGNESAAHELEQLAAATELGPWKDKLRHASSTQKVSRREAEFRHPSPAQVLETLRSGRPANAADLAALTLEILKDLAAETRHSSADSYKQYWNVDSHNSPENSRPEEACRNELLSHLSPRLKSLGIDVQPEVQHADRKRSDLNVTYMTLNGQIRIPIEIKKDSHDDLWRGINGQLIPRYTTGLGTEGRGIYLVFWFGGNGMPMPPHGNKPKTAKDLEEQLYATLTIEQRPLISVVVFDCAIPNSETSTSERSWQCQQ